MMETKILETQDISIGYTHSKSQNVVAQNISISLTRGKLISLIGANGIGKSTLLRTITGIQKPLLGNVLLNDKNISQYTTLELAQQLSLVLTEKLPPSSLTVFELIALGRQPYTNWLGQITADDSRQIHHAMEITETAHLAVKKYYELSDGQLQKVLVARAIAQDTPLIVLDEPTTHLDLQNKVGLFKLLKKLAHESGKAILFSTHDIDMAIQLSDEMILMASGNVIQDTPEKLISINVFDNLFENDSITFDRDKVKFVFKNL